MRSRRPARRAEYSDARWIETVASRWVTAPVWRVSESGRLTCQLGSRTSVGPVDRGLRTWPPEVVTLTCQPLSEAWPARGSDLRAFGNPYHVRSEHTSRLTSNTPPGCLRQPRGCEFPTLVVLDSRSRASHPGPVGPPLVRVRCLRGPPNSSTYPLHHWVDSRGLTRTGEE